MSKPVPAKPTVARLVPAQSAIRPPSHRPASPTAYQPSAGLTQAKLVVSVQGAISGRQLPRVPQPYRPQVPPAVVQAKAGPLRQARVVSSVPPVFRPQAATGTRQRRAAMGMVPIATPKGGLLGPPPRWTSVGIIQRLMDRNGVVLTEAMVDAQAVIATLREWRQLPKQSWDSDEDDSLKLRIDARILALEAAAAAAALAARRTALETSAGGPLPNFDDATLTRIGTLSLGDRARFFQACLAVNTAPATVAQSIINASTSATSRKRGLEAFAARGASIADATRLAGQYDALIALRMNSPDLCTTIVGLVNNGSLSVSRITYVDTPMRAGSVYVFSLTRTANDRLTPEWHVHWGAGNVIEAASFKNVRHAIGARARVTTSPADNTALKGIVGAALWGPG